jgi:hypothetical protein
LKHRNIYPYILYNNSQLEKNLMVDLEIEDGAAWSVGDDISLKQSGWTFKLL